ncbi:MAG: winged helix-turn-helix transcriptional regulator [Candidatus Hermodarchaeota archaeon]
MLELKKSPISLTLQLIGKKWTTEIITDLMSGRKRFSDLLDSNPDISSKMLSERLKELYNEGFIDKIIINMIPLRVKYQITSKGKLLNRVLYEMAIFGSLVYPQEVFNTPPKEKSTIIQWFADLFGIDETQPET